MDVSSSSSSSSSSLPTRDVFLNFRGEDTRKNFVCHLYEALKGRAVNVYLDNEDLREGDDLSDLLKAIAESKISIVVFSENYATSPWCLKELVKILEFKANQKQIVMPIFYRVAPSDIRNQTGSFAKAFANHEEDKKLLQEVQPWRSALREAANLAGWDSENYEDDAQLIDDIVKEVFDKVNWISPHTQDDLVAMDSHLHQVGRLLSAAPDDVVYVGIWGVGGLGKTTIARAVYDTISHQFDHRCFLQNVREGFTRNGEVQMKVEFLSGILNEKVSNFDGGYMKMLKRLGDKKILVVLDDVLDSSQIDTLLGQKCSFGGGSIVIVTTRDKHAVSEFKIYKPMPLSDPDALKLFSQKAFDTFKPSEEYEHLSRCIVEYAHGLPLALIVLGGLLRNRSVSQWEAQFKKLKKYPNPQIEDMLKISYDELDPSQQEIFLDIACFFKGMDKDSVTDVLVNCDYITPHFDLDVLVERALVTISYSKKLEMHDLLQEMGRKIESTKEDGKRSRFLGVLTENTATEYAERLMIDLPNKEDVSFNTSMLIFTYGQRSAGDDGENHLTGDFKFLSHELKVLIWHRYPLKCLPSNFDPNNLFQLDMPYSNIEQLWEGSKPAKRLISINLSGSPYLKRIPDLTHATNLKELHLMDVASSSSSSSSSSSLPYDVFLSFRGQDTRESFVCYLHKALERKTLKVYLDNEELKTGDDLSDLQKAIAESKISIVVFSENYATSTWCLKELVQILECKAKQNQIVMPIFYRVDPSDIRKQTGSFAEAFAEHERDPKKDKEEVLSWRFALKEVGSIVGCHSTNFGDDAHLIDDIVKEVFDKVNRISPHTEDGLVAMDSHLHQVGRLLNAAPADVVYVGIWGMGGLGKTTIARAVYDRISHKFDHRCFLQNVRERFTRNEVQMKVEFLSAILNSKVSNFDGGYTKMLTRLGDKKILVVLDDVLNSTQIDTLLGQTRSFGGGSIIIVTTRDEHVVRGFKIYKPEALSDEDALKLFSQKAFKTYKPPGEYEHRSKCIVQYAHGLPLALIVLGAFFLNRSESQWEGQLKKLKKLKGPQIKDVLKISYDGLDASQQDIFLDIACFFKGMDRDYVTEVLVNCDSTPDIDLDVLVERALVTISYYNELEMHDLLQEMGMDIETTKDGKRSRFWGEEAERVLTENTATEYAERLMIDLPNKKDGFFNTSMRIFTYGKRYAGDEGENHLIGDYKFLSRELKVLIWHGYPQKCLPSNFDLKSLVQLDLRCSNIEQLWEGSKPAKELRSINLIRSPYLKRIPDLTLATNLKELNFYGCSSLTEVHPSISALKNLISLRIQVCSKLKRLPSSIHMKSLKTLILWSCPNLEMFPEISEDMGALSELHLGATAIKELPWSIERLRGLKKLSMTGCRSLTHLPDSICNLAELESLKLDLCPKLRNLPEIGNLESLLELEVDHSGFEQLPVSILRLKHGRLSFSGCRQMAAPLSSWPSSVEDRCTVVVHLNLSDCNMMELSDAIAYFPSLKVLRLSRNNLESLPASMNGLASLEQLELEGCKRLRSIPELSSTISYINAHDCTALESVSTPQSPYDIGRCFILSNCSQLVQKDVFRDIVETHFLPQGNCSRPFYVSLPGSEIPEWFTHQCRGSSVTAKLPPNWFDNKFLGFTICAIINKPQEIPECTGFSPQPYFELTARCVCTFKGDLCEYRFSFYLFDIYSSGGSCWPESNHMLVGYVPWSESGMIKREEVNERRYTEAKFEIQLPYWSNRHDAYAFCGLSDGFYPSVERCGVRFAVANNEEDSREPMVEVDNSERCLEECLAESCGSDITCDTSDEEEQSLKLLSEVFKGANRAPSCIEIEDNDSSKKRITLESWTQKVRVTSGLRQGLLDDGYNWSRSTYGFERDEYDCAHSGTHLSGWKYHQPDDCRAKAMVRTHIDPTILEVNYIVSLHTCWRFQPMLTHQVRVTPGMGTEGPFDGFTWGEYDQMDIPGAEYPRVYYVCTPQQYGGCMAIKEVQRSNDQKILKITYRGRHTCTLPSPDIGGRTDSSTSVASGASSVHDQVVELPSSPGANGDGGNVSSQDMKRTPSNVASASSQPGISSPSLTQGKLMKTKSVAHKGKPIPKPVTRTSARARTQQGPKEGSNKKMWKP